jgi:hypothetical protein
MPVGDVPTARETIGDIFHFTTDDPRLEPLVRALTVMAEEYATAIERLEQRVAILEEP